LFDTDGNEQSVGHNITVTGAQLMSAEDLHARELMLRSWTKPKLTRLA
jgi:hypothetical protein